LAIEPAPTAAEPVLVSLTGEIAVPEAVAVDIPISSDITPLPAPAVGEPTVTLEKALSESGLVLVQTTMPAAVVSSEPPPRLGRPRKQQAHDATADEAPLVMVETTK
jgi:ribonuclease E